MDTGKTAEHDGAALGVHAFSFEAGKVTHTHEYLWKGIQHHLRDVPKGVRVLDVGCGDATLSSRMIERGDQVVGIDASESGIAVARQMFPRGRWETMLADEKVLERLGEAPFDVVLSTEVVEHLYDPRAYMKGCVSAMKPGGKIIVSTPYHGYLKNLALGVMGKWDSHADPLWDGGHIKLWSAKKLGELMREFGLKDVEFYGAGRLPGLWMSMVMSARKPG